MANQAIALQARAPSASSGGNVFAQNMQMMNMMAQRTAAERQAATAQQASEFAQAKEAREAALHPAALAKGKAEATAEEIKTAQLFNNAVYTAAANSNSPEDFVAFAQRIAAAPEFQNQLFFGGLNTVLKSMPADPAKFPEWRRQTGALTVANDKRYEEKLQTQKTGTEERIISIPAYGGGPATEVPGSRIQTAQDITYVRGEDGSVRAMPKNMPGTGGFGAPAPAAPAAGLVGGARGDALGPSIEQFAQQLSPGVVVSGRARTPERNAQVGGVPGSYHLTDNARDLQPGKGQTLAGLYNSLAPLKARGFDVIKERNHVHVEPSPGKAPAPRGGAGGIQFGQVVPGMEGKPPKAKEPAISPEKKLARDTAVQNLYDSVMDAQAKGHLVAGDKSYVENRAQELLQGRTYLPGGTAKKTSIDDINAAATQLLRMFIEKGTSGTLNTKAEQELFLRSVGGANSTYETRLKTIRNFAKQNGIVLDDYAAAGAPQTSTSKMSAETRAKYGLK